MIDKKCPGIFSARSKSTPVPLQPINRHNNNYNNLSKTLTTSTICQPDSEPYLLKIRPGSTRLSQHNKFKHNATTAPRLHERLICGVTIAESVDILRETVQKRTVRRNYEESTVNREKKISSNIWTKLPIYSEH